MTDDTPSFTRREYTMGAVGLGLFGLGGATTFMSTSDAEDDEGNATYILKQGKLRWEVEALSDGELNVREFYNVTGTSAKPTTDIVETEAASRLFVYEGPVDTSLVFLHGSRDVEHGGTAFFKFSGLSREQGEWAVRDDPLSVSDDFEKWEGGNSKVKWEWGENTTDGGAYWGVPTGENTVKVTPKTLRGVDAWRFLSGDIADPERYELYERKAVQLKPTTNKSVKQANIDILPDQEENEFDPYAQEPITVAVRDPPEDAEGEWVSPGELDPGNYALNFGSRSYLAGGNAAQPQSYTRENGTLELEFKASAANFTLDSSHGFLVGKADDKTWIRGKDTVSPGGFDNTEADSAELAIAEFHPDSEGLNGEYVTFENEGAGELDLSGWTLENEAGWVFEFGNTTLAAGATLTVHTGDGEWTDSELYWGLDESVWAGDDTVHVIDDGGNTVIERSFPQQ